MAHSIGTTHKHGYGNSSTPRTSTVPTIKQLLRASSEGWWWSGQKSITYYREHDPEDHGGQDFHSKSVLAKVKDRAHRWRQNLGKKKGIDHENGMGTPFWGVTLEEEEEDSEDDAEYLGAPSMSESELAPKDCRENAGQHPRVNPVISENHILRNSPRLGDPLSTNSSICPIKTTDVNRSVLTHDTTSMMQGLTIGPRRDAASSDRASVSVARQNPASPAGNISDGVSMREYLSHKLEPGEDDRALSQGITNIMSPRKARDNANHPHDVSIVEKVKDAISSLLHTRESSSALSSNAYSASRRVPVTNPTPEVMEEESHGWILQAN